MKYIAPLLVLFSACVDVGIEPPPPQMRPLTAIEQKLVQSSQKFWIPFLKEINKADSAKNIFISPLSISFAFGMALNGAEGETYDAIRTVFALDGLSREEINSSFKSLMQTLTTVDPKVRMQIANSIWIREGFYVEPDFINVNKTYFDALVRVLNFSSPDAAQTINSWVSEKTNDKIRSIVEPPIPPEVVMYLINALYFKGAWTHQFKPEQTRSDHFTLLDGSRVPCSMMNQEASFPVVFNERFLAIDLPYAHRIFSMTVLLPGEGRAINDFIASLTEQEWQRILEGLSESTVMLSMPKFKIEYDLDLKAPLRDLGMGIAFDPYRADFRRISQAVYQSGERLYISKARHKTFVEVNEEGTEAAAVTSIEFGITSAPPSIRIDRPFLFVIRERTSGAILFAGKIMNPNG